MNDDGFWMNIRSAVKSSGIEMVSNMLKIFGAKTRKRTKTKLPKFSVESAKKIVDETGGSNDNSIR